MIKKRVIYCVLGLTFCFALLFIIIILIKVDYENKSFKEVRIEDRNDEDLGVLTEYSSENSVAYENTDGTKTLIIYSTPIQYINTQGKLEYIDDSLVKINQVNLNTNGYNYTIANSDIKSYYPDELNSNKGIKIVNDYKLDYNYEYEIGLLDDNTYDIEIIDKDNFINKSKKMCSYKNILDGCADLNFYPSSLGANCEIMYHKKPSNNVIKFWLKITSDVECNITKEGGYLTIFHDIHNERTVDSEVIGIIQTPIIKDKDGNISYNNDINYEEVSKNNYLVTVKLDDKYLDVNTSVFISNEMRRVKQVDNTLYSKFPDLKFAYLKNYYCIGNSIKYGIGRTMIRFDLFSRFNINSEDIISANYLLYSLTNNSMQYELYTITDDWCSILGNWNSNYQMGDNVGNVKIYHNEILCNITNLCKIWADDTVGDKEKLGLMIKSKNEQIENENVILSNDNTLYPTRTEIIFK